MAANWVQKICSFVWRIVSNYTLHPNHLHIFCIAPDFGRELCHFQIGQNLSLLGISAVWFLHRFFRTGFPDLHSASSIAECDTFYSQHLFSCWCHISFLLFESGNSNYCLKKNVSRSFHIDDSFLVCQPLYYQRRLVEREIHERDFRFGIWNGIGGISRHCSIANDKSTAQNTKQLSLDYYRYFFL